MSQNGSSAPAETLVLPRVVIAAPASGHGKTTVASGLMGALRHEGLDVAAFKVGPDYIDPGYHAMATGRTGRNLDPHLCGEDQIVPLLMHGAVTPTPADVAVVEGVMGLFDGQIGGQGFASTAHVAGLIGAPVILVIDISQVSRTAAALVHGLNTFDPAVRLGGVILNKAGSERHAVEICSAMESTGIEVLGVLPRDAGIEAPSRHLGLVPAAERGDAATSLSLLADNVGRYISLASVLEIAHSAPAVTGVPWAPEHVVRPASAARPVIAVAGGRAFTFRYAETEELLRAAGCEPVVFDPLADTSLPRGTAGIYLGGGFPEVHAVELSANAALRASLLAAIRAGVPTVAECAGLLYLCDAVDGHPMVGAVTAEAVMTPKLTLSYRTAVADSDSLLAAAGSRVTGHEFHRTTVTPASGHDQATGSGWLMAGQAAGFSADPAGLGRPTLHASYLHTHWAGHPQLAQRFADEAHAATARGAPSVAGGATAEADGVTDGVTAEANGVAHRRDLTSEGDGVTAEADGVADQRGQTSGTSRTTSDQMHPLQTVHLVREGAAAGSDQPHRHPGNHDLAHHGDDDLEAGLVDLAVNVRLPAPPEWLVDRIQNTTSTLAAYPRPDAATRAIARAHGVPEDHVLPTSGGAEAFTLLARALQPAYPLVVHPQFTEPEAALLAAGHRPHRLLLEAAAGFRLDPAQIPAAADLVLVGNPTNPTSVLHPATMLRQLLRPGRVLGVDEAFMDAVPGEPESMLDSPYEGLMVLRSLTKTWGLAGLRAGYAVGDPAVIAAMRAQQPPWSVSTPALAAIEACLSPTALGQARAGAEELVRRRDHLTEELAAIGLPVAGRPAAPFVLVDTSGWDHPDRGPDWVRLALRTAGFAVRRGETFPGLTERWLRIAVRDEQTTGALIEALLVIRTTLDGR